MVADGGQVYLSGIPQEGTLDVAWNADNISRRCALHFHLTDTVQQRQSPVKTVSGFCQ
jgi:outer membrane usher protein